MAGGLDLLGGIAINRLRDSSQEAAVEGAWRLTGFHDATIVSKSHRG